MVMRNWLLKLILVLLVGLLVRQAPAGTFGRVVPIGGQAADLALDEGRGVLYIANFTANRIEVMSVADGTIQRSLNVAAQPSSLSVSPNGRWLLVSHYGAVAAPQTARNSLTLIDLDTNSRQTFGLANPPVGVAFGADNLALVVTTTDFLLFDPALGTTQQLSTFKEVATKMIPQPPASFPVNVTTASMGISEDKQVIFGLTDTFEFTYQVANRGIIGYVYFADPAMAPRAVAVNHNGTRAMLGWALRDRDHHVVAQFNNSLGFLEVGGHVMDSRRGLLYTQVAIRGAASTTATTPTTGGGTATGGAGTPNSQVEKILQIVDHENLAVKERLNLSENLAGKGILSPDGNTGYVISDSGIMILPVGQLEQQKRIKASAQDLVFQGSFCDKRMIVREFTLTDTGGGATDFQLSTTTAGVTISPSQGVTPATIRVTIDPTSFQNVKGTVAASIKVTSTGAVNEVPAVRVLINNREPDQRGLTVNLPGKLVDVLADPRRDRFFVLRKDTNEVLVFDGSTYTQIATLRTSAEPTQMAISWDQRWLVIGSDASWQASVYDLETLQESAPVKFPAGHYPRSLAASARGMMAAIRCACPTHQIDRVDMTTRSASAFPTLGVWENKIADKTVLIGSANGSRIMAAQQDGYVMLYDGNADTFTVSRRDVRELDGAYAASAFDQFVIGNALLNSSLVTVKRFDDGLLSSGFAFIDQQAFRLTTAGTQAPGVIQRVVDVGTDAKTQRTTRLTESPLTGDGNFPFTRTMAVLPNQANIVVLTVSGFTVLPWGYDSATTPPRLSRLVNAADGQRPVAPGGLVTIFGEGLSPVNVATKQIPLPTALGESCLTVNGMALPLIFVSDKQINAQLPFNLTGNVTLVLRTPGGISDNFNFTILPTAPGVFRQQVPGLADDVPVIVNARNGLLATGSNPVKRGDRITIYLTGLGRTDPPIAEGLPAPESPRATALTPAEVTIGGVEIPVDFAGLTPGQVGMNQINATIPRTVPLGMEVPLVITQGASQTQMMVRVIE